MGKGGAQWATSYDAISSYDLCSLVTSQVSFQEIPQAPPGDWQPSWQPERGQALRSLEVLLEFFSSDLARNTEEATGCLTKSGLSSSCRTGLWSCRVDQCGWSLGHLPSPALPIGSKQVTKPHTEICSGYAFDIMNCRL